MRHLYIEKFGPVNKADVEIGRLNVIVGPQSSGKSSVLKVAAYCAWLEKRIETTQNLSFASWENVEEHLIAFYNLSGYFTAQTIVTYETDCIYIKLRNKAVSAQWKEGRWGYKRPKVAYIPAERNIVSIIDNWQKVKAAENILEFMDEWDIARKSRVRSLRVLNLGVQYSYDAVKNEDRVLLDNGLGVDLSSTSSGLQSLIPLYVNLYYLHKGQYQVRYKKENFLSKSESLKFLEFLIDELSQKHLPQNALREFNLSPRAAEDAFGLEYQIRRSRLYSNYMDVKNTQVYLEEPEDNLFPPEQTVLTEWLIKMGTDPFRKNVLFLATHSPYIVNCFLEREKKDFNLLITAPLSDGTSVVKNVSEEDIQRIYDSGVDVFFNYEAFV